MGTLSQYINLSDGVSGPLQRMANNANAAVNRMERLGKAATMVEVEAAGMNAPAAALSRVSTAAIGTSTSIAKIVPASAAAQNAIGAIGSKASGVFNSIKGSISGMIGMFAGMFAIGSLTSIMNQAKDAAAAQGQADLRLTVIMRQRMGANRDMISSVQDLITAQQGLGVIGRTVQTAGAQQLATFLTQKDSLAELIPAMNNLAVQQHGSKATAEDMVGISNMMGRALQGNVGALTRCGISFNDAQADILKFGTESQRAAVMAEVITQNVGNMNAEFGKTGGGQATQKMNEMNDVLIRVGKGIKGAFDQLKISSGDIQIGAIETIGWAFTGVINSLTWFAQAASKAYQAVKPLAQDMGQFFQSNWSLIEPILIGIIAALAVYELSMLSGVFASIAATGASVVHAAASVAETAAIIALTLAQDGLTAAMALCPWTWVAFAVIALVAIFYLAVAAVNHFAGTSISATGIIVGAFFWLGGMIYNLVALLWNIFLSLAEFLGNVFKNPAAATYNLFATIWNGIVELVGRSVNEIIGLVNKLPGMNMGFVNWGRGLAHKMQISSGVDLSAYQMDYSSGNFMKGYDLGAGLGDKFKNLFTPDMPGTPGGDSPAGPGVPEALREGSGPAKDTAGSTGRMADKMDDVDEDLKYLREVAEQEAINKYTTAEVKIEMGGIHNNVGSEVDIDGMISYINNSLIGAMQAGAEAVHP